MTERDALNPSIAALSAATALFVGLLYLKGRGWISNFALLLGMIVGWIVFEWLFPDTAPRHALLRPSFRRSGIRLVSLGSAPGLKLEL
ncbi:hypothetical protein D3H35_03515 [Cohnella faecalis]|uniref:Uncharacterized protein n=1 Tax=Cohnella faecalis TaxID=2315694 RepID=A0A398CUG3_9BACL|nr:hypothetical protein D3H35_03515 [Cohnella faecalis]